MVRTPKSALTIDPAPRLELSPHLYMQFVEPLGDTDGSVSAAWNHLESRWRQRPAREGAEPLPCSRILNERKVDERD